MNERAPATTAPPLEHGSNAEQDAFADLVGRELSDVNERGDEIINSFEQGHDVSNSPEQSTEIEAPSIVVGKAIERFSAHLSLAPSPEKGKEKGGSDSNIINAEVVEITEHDPAEKTEAAKAAVAETGHAALEAAKNAAETSPSLTALGEASDEVTAADSTARPGITRRIASGIKNVANNAYARFSLRMMEAQGLVNNESINSQPEGEVSTPEVEQAKIDADVEAFRKQRTQQSIDKAHEEAMSMNEAYDDEQRIQQARHEAEIKARAANIAKIRRQQARQEVYNSLGNAAQEHLDQLRSRVKKSKIGRIIGFFRRHSRKARAAFSAYRSTT